MAEKGDEPGMFHRDGNDPEAHLLDDAWQLLARLIARKHIKSWQSEADGNVRDSESNDSDDK